MQFQKFRSFFEFQFSENPEKKAEAEGDAPPVDRSQKPNTVSGGQGGGMGYRVRDINEIPSMVSSNSEFYEQGFRNNSDRVVGGSNSPCNPL